ncbi:MAG TPA: hypothetical protein VMW47_01460 [Verrucomicrobiae bacterium]|nr:hypothetical protein [Verrucomicrobiae bacterium]
MSADPIEAVPRGRSLTVAVVGAGPVRGDGGCSLDCEMPAPAAAGLSRYGPSEVP